MTDVFDLDDDWWDYDDDVPDEDVEPDRGPWWGVWGLGLPEYDDPEETGAPKLPEPQWVYHFTPVDGPCVGMAYRMEPYRPGWQPSLPDWPVYAMDENGLMTYCLYRWRGDGYRLAMKVAPGAVMFESHGVAVPSASEPDIVGMSPASVVPPTPVMVGGPRA